jgi:uncharacterized protein (DUF2235 family)
MEQNYETNQNSEQASERKSFTMRRTICSTDYEVEVHFSQTCRETLLDKIRRLIRNEVQK